MYALAGFMFRLTSQMSTSSEILLFVILPSLISAAIVIVVRRVKSIPLLAANNEFAAIMYPVIGLFYGVFLAFAIVIVWQRYTDAQSSTYREVAALSDLWRDTQLLPQAERDRTHHQIQLYITSVINDEWPAMTRSGADEVHDTAYEDLWQSLYVYEPHGEAEKAFFAKAIDQLNAVGGARRERLMYSGSEMPELLWAFLLFGAVVTIVYSYFLGTKHFLTHALTSAALTSIVGFSLLLIVELQFPFSGPVSISHTPYTDLSHVLSAR